MLLSFHNDEKLKQFYVNRMYAHAAADEIVKGQYWEGGKGCAVGCAIHSENYADYPQLLGLPTWLAMLQDQLFEGQENNDAKQFAVSFFPAIPTGSNLEPVRWQFCAYLMRENIERVLTLDLTTKLQTQVVDAIRGVLLLHEQAIESGQWDEAAAEAAKAAATAAANAVWAAAWTAEAPNAAWAATWTAEAAPNAAWAATWTAEAAAEAADAAAKATAKATAWAAAWTTAAAPNAAAYKKYADELLRLLKSAG